MELLNATIEDLMANCFFVKAWKERFQQMKNIMLLLLIEDVLTKVLMMQLSLMTRNQMFPASTCLGSTQKYLCLPCHTGHISPLILPVILSYVVMCLTQESKKTKIIYMLALTYFHGWKESAFFGVVPSSLTKQSNRPRW